MGSIFRRTDYCDGDPRSLPHHSTTVDIRGESYGLKERRKSRSDSSAGTAAAQVSDSCRRERSANETIRYESCKA
jgi:hypothetical protein